jgi:ABC-type cobalamin/Fe3+-siderophores transport system ATPase subunit
VVNEVSRLASYLRDKIKHARNITTASLYRCLFSNYLAVRPALLYKRTPIGKLSLGQKATVLIKIYLAQGTNPILIDSHDEHLDNEFIMEELVDAIREAKRHRQVIFASNNGNVVINSDAEQVVIAQRIDGEVSYQSGSIEEPKTRQRALTVLEGGLIAFQRRQAKYGIPN